MAQREIVEIIRRYIKALPKYGFHATRAVLYGSFATETAHEWSDIDLIVLAPEFDKPYDMTAVEKLWIATQDADDRIEPIPCGEKEWETDDSRPIIEIARREGIVIAA